MPQQTVTIPVKIMASAGRGCEYGSEHTLELNISIETSRRGNVKGVWLYEVVEVDRTSEDFGPCSLRFDL